MCFSAQASFVASACLAVAGVATLKQVRSRADLPYAAFPMTFAVQQATEGGLWLTLHPGGSAVMTRLLSVAFVFFALCFWPAFFPVAVYRMERNSLARKGIFVFILLGVSLALFNLYFMATSNLEVRVVAQSLRYVLVTPLPLFTGIAYQLSIFGPAFLSRRFFIGALGVGLMLSRDLAAALYAKTNASVWCFFAAVLSLMILAHLVLRNRHRARSAMTGATAPPPR